MTSSVDWGSLQHRVRSWEWELASPSQKRVECSFQFRDELLPWIFLKWEESGAGDWQTLCSYTDPVKVYYRKEIAKRERKAVDLPSIYLPTLSYGHVICEVTKRITSQSQARKMRFVCDSVVALSLRDKVRSSVTQKRLSVETPWHWKESWFGNVLPKEGPRADLAWECVPKDELERESLLRQSQTRQCRKLLRTTTVEFP